MIIDGLRISKAGFPSSVIKDLRKIGQLWHPWHVFWHEHKEAIDTEAARLCAEAIEARKKRPKGGDPTHFNFRE